MGLPSTQVGWPCIDQLLITVKRLLSRVSLRKGSLSLVQKQVLIFNTLNTYCSKVNTHSLFMDNDVLSGRQTKNNHDTSAMADVAWLFLVWRPDNTSSLLGKHLCTVCFRCDDTLLKQFSKVKSIMWRFNYELNLTSHSLFQYHHYTTTPGPHPITYIRTHSHILFHPCTSVLLKLQWCNISTGDGYVLSKVIPRWEAWIPGAYSITLDEVIGLLWDYIYIYSWKATSTAFH